MELVGFWRDPVRKTHMANFVKEYKFIQETMPMHFLQVLLWKCRLSIMVLLTLYIEVYC